MDKPGKQQRVQFCPCQVNSLVLYASNSTAVRYEMALAERTWRRKTVLTDGPKRKPILDKYAGRKEKVSSDMYNIGRLTQFIPEKNGDKHSVPEGSSLDSSSVSHRTMMFVCRSRERKFFLLRIHLTETGTLYGLLVPGEKLNEKHNVLLIMVPSICVNCRNVILFNLLESILTKLYTLRIKRNIVPNTQKVFIFSKFICIQKLFNEILFSIQNNLSHFMNKISNLYFQNKNKFFKEIKSVTRELYNSNYFINNLERITLQS